MVWQWINPTVWNCKLIGLTWNVCRSIQQTFASFPLFPNTVGMFPSLVNPCAHLSIAKPSQHGGVQPAHNGLPGASPCHASKNHEDGVSVRSCEGWRRATESHLYDTHRNRGGQISQYNSQPIWKRIRLHYNSFWAHCSFQGECFTFSDF